MISGILSVLAALAAPVAWFICRKRKIPLLLGFAGAFILGGIFYFGTCFAYGMELEHEMHRFDLNGDKEFSESELTAEAKTAIKRWSSDTGRSFATIVAPLASFVWTSVIFSSFLAAVRVRDFIRIRNKN